MKKTNYRVDYVTPTDNSEAHALAKMLATFGATDIGMDSRTISVTWASEEMEKLFNQALEKEILKRLTRHMDQSIALLRDGGWNFQSIDTTGLRVRLAALIGELQDRGVLSANFRVNNGTILPESPDDQQTDL